MRGKDEWSGSLCIHLDLEARAGQSHPMPAIRGFVNEAQAALYSPIGRPSRPTSGIASISISAGQRR